MKEKEYYVGKTITEFQSDITTEFDYRIVRDGDILYAITDDSIDSRWNIELDGKGKITNIYNG